MSIEHGGNVHLLAKQLGYAIDDCIDFSANINPFGVSTALRKTITQTIDKLVHYPDIHYTQSKQALALFHNVNIESIVLSNGAVELFYELARFFKPNQLLTLSPTFMEYEKAFKQVGTTMIHYVLESPDYQWQFHQLLPYLKKLSKNDCVLICNPNNPTGTLVQSTVLTQVAKYLQTIGAFLIIDEAFIDFVDKDALYTFVPFLKKFPNVIVVKSLTKFYAIPGLRLGYALSYHHDCLKTIEHVRAPWTINTLADSAVPIILADTQYQEQTKKWLMSEKIFLYNALCQFDTLSVVMPSVNYIFFEYTGTIDLRQTLWEHKIFIRSCQNYRHLTKQHYRVAVRSREENEKLIEALNDVL